MAKSRKYSKRRGRKTRKHRHSLGTKCKICSKKTIKGGNCSSCSMHKIGGGFYKPAAPMPGPFVGHSWKAPVVDWPGVNGVGGDRNYLAYNSYPTDPQTAMKLYGGKKSRRRGGGFIPQDLVNIGRDIGYNMGSTYNALNGYPAPVNPLPYKDQFSSANNNGLRSLLA